MNVDHPTRVLGFGGRWGVAVNVRGVDRDQVFLMPPSVRDWVPEGHLVWTVLDAVAELDLAAFYAAYRARRPGWARCMTRR